jgi:hypothetical protein
LHLLTTAYGPSLHIARHAGSDANGAKLT